MIIDTPTNIQSHVKQLKAAGVTTVFRYESRLPNASWKRWQPTEVKAISDAGLHLAIVYEDNGRPASYADGYEAACYALGRCEARGQPDGSAIYYAADYDASVSDVNERIVPYWHGVNAAHKKLRPKVKIGCYGSGLVCRTLLAVKLIDLRWITCSLGFSGSRDAVRKGEYEIWQSHCDTSLLGIDIDSDVAKVDDFGQFAPWGVINFPKPQPMKLAALTASPPAAFAHGRGSWYSQFNGIYTWEDKGDEPGSAALGCPDDCQGISFYDHSTLGKWFELHAPNGVVLMQVQQTDIGPAPWTGRKIDIAAVTAERLGYSPRNFPTNGMFSWRPTAPPFQVAQLSPRQQAIKWKQIRQEDKIEVEAA